MVEVIVDDRELQSNVVNELALKGAKLKVQRLEIADYVVSEKVAIERKRVKDFVNSLLDGRLFSQSIELKQNYERPIIIVEGETDVFKVRAVHPNAIRGAIAALARLGIPIIFSKDEKETAEYIFILAKKEQAGGGKPKIAKKKPLSLKEMQEAIVASLPGVGIGLARRLLRHFKTVERVMRASAAELMKVEKIGERKAKLIRKVLTSFYE